MSQKSLHLQLVGAERLELSTYWSQTSRATRLRYAPILNKKTLGNLEEGLFISTKVVCF